MTFEARPEKIMVRVSKKEKATMGKNADTNNQTLSAYVRTRACKCGVEGYEGVFVSVDWTCTACGAKNSWRKKAEGQK
jgi:hypothetical protein